MQVKESFDGNLAGGYYKRSSLATVRALSFEQLTSNYDLVYNYDIDGKRFYNVKPKQES